MNNTPWQANFRHDNELMRNFKARLEERKEKKKREKLENRSIANHYKALERAKLIDAVRAIKGEQPLTKEERRSMGILEE